MEGFIDDNEYEDEGLVAKASHGNKRRKKKKPTNYRLDDEDREVIKENTGIDVKPKNRLKRNAERASEHRDEAMAVDDKA